MPKHPEGTLLYLLEKYDSSVTSLLVQISVDHRFVKIKKAPEYGVFYLNCSLLLGFQLELEIINYLKSKKTKVKVGYSIFFCKDCFTDRNMCLQA